MLHYMLFSRYGALGLLVAAIVVGLILLPTQTVLMIAGGLAALGGIVLLFVAPPYAALAIPAGVALLICGVALQRRIDAREADEIRKDAARHARRNEFYVGPDR